MPFNATHPITRLKAYRFSLSTLKGLNTSPKNSLKPKMLDLKVIMLSIDPSNHHLNSLWEAWSKRNETKINEDRYWPIWINIYTLHNPLWGCLPIIFCILSAKSVAGIIGERQCSLGIYFRLWGTQCIRRFRQGNFIFDVSKEAASPIPSQAKGNSE